MKTDDDGVGLILKVASRKDRTLWSLWLAVVSDPKDTVARLVLADWLEENGYDWRADMIRGEAPPDPKMTAAVRRIRENVNLTFAAGDKWRNGFPYSWSGTIASFVQNARWLARQIPLEEVVVTDRDCLHSLSRPAWFKSRTLARDDPDDIPGCIFSFLATSTPTLWEWCEFDSEAEAMKALSRACLDYARTFIPKKRI